MAPTSSFSSDNSCQPSDQSSTEENPTVDTPTPKDSLAQNSTAVSSDSSHNSETGKETEVEPNPAPFASQATPWQAIWSPQHNAYYFYNPETQETTWTNPLQHPQVEDQSKSAPPTTPSYASPLANLQAAAEAAGIDPSLAYLDPSFSSVPGAAPGAYAATARFNARTGAFTKPEARAPVHLSEYERAKRMSEFYFDVGAWEKDVEERRRLELEEEVEGSAKKRKRPTKKDLERFKEQKRLKKIAKTAWLRT